MSHSLENEVESVDRRQTNSTRRGVEVWTERRNCGFVRYPQHSGRQLFRQSVSALAQSTEHLGCFRFPPRHRSVSISTYDELGMSWFLMIHKEGERCVPGRWAAPTRSPSAHHGVESSHSVNNATHGQVKTNSGNQCCHCTRHSRGRGIQ